MASRKARAYNGHFGCTCYHPLFVFNQFGDLERCALRPGNVHSAHEWRDVLEPVVARYRDRLLRRYFRGDAAFALPGICEFLEAEGFRYLPEGMIRHEADANPEGLRILRLRGNSMEPEMSAGDRLVVDTARRIPATGEMAVLWDGNGLVVKRIETVREPGPPQLRLISTNPDYAPYTCLAQEAHIVGRVLWSIRRV